MLGETQPLKCNICTQWYSVRRHFADAQRHAFNACEACLRTPPLLCTQDYRIYDILFLPRGRADPIALQRLDKALTIIPTLAPPYLQLADAFAQLQTCASSLTDTITTLHSERIKIQLRAVHAVDDSVEDVIRDAKNSFQTAVRTLQSLPLKRSLTDMVTDCDSHLHVIQQAHLKLQLLQQKISKKQMKDFTNVSLSHSVILQQNQTSTQKRLKEVNNVSMNNSVCLTEIESSHQNRAGKHSNQGSCSKLDQLYFKTRRGKENCNLNFAKQAPNRVTKMMKQKVLGKGYDNNRIKQEVSSNGSKPQLFSSQIRQQLFVQGEREQQMAKLKETMKMEQRERREKENREARERKQMLETKDMMMESMRLQREQSQQKANINSILKRRKMTASYFQQRQRKAEGRMKKSCSRKNMVEAIWETRGKTTLNEELLDLSCRSVEMLDFECFLKSLRLPPTLKVVRIIRANLVDADFDALLRLLARAPTVHTLVASNNRLTCASIRAILSFKTRQTQSQLGRVYMAHNAVKPSSVRPLLPTLTEVGVHLLL